MKKKNTAINKNNVLSPIYYTYPQIVYKLNEFNLKLSEIPTGGMIDPTPEIIEHKSKYFDKFFNESTIIDDGELNQLLAVYEKYLSNFGLALFQDDVRQIDEEDLLKINFKDANLEEFKAYIYTAISCIEKILILVKKFKIGGESKLDSNKILLTDKGIRIADIIDNKLDINNSQIISKSFLAFLIFDWKKKVLDKNQMSCKEFVQILPIIVDKSVSISQTYSKYCNPKNNYTTPKNYDFYNKYVKDFINPNLPEDLQ